MSACLMSGQFWRRRCPAIGHSALIAITLGLAVGSAQATVSPIETGAERLHRTLLRSEALALENGEGVERDPERAARLYCDAARLGDAEAQFNLGWMYANGRGVERSDATAAYFFPVSYTHLTLPTNREV